MELRGQLRHSKCKGVESPHFINKEITMKDYTKYFPADNPLTHVDRLLAYLRTGQRITVLDAMHKLNDSNVRLAVHKLRKRGYNIICEMKPCKEEKGRYLLCFF